MQVSAEQANSNHEKLLFGHPIGLFVLFLTEMWERFSYYGMRAILFLYMTTDIIKGGMGMQDKEAGAVYGIYVASIYLLSLPGGWLADNIFGQKKSVIYGGLIIILGHLILAIPGNNIVFYIGLAIVSIGTGALKPNISSLVGELYPEGGARRDAAFSIFYMGINLGGAFGMIIVGYLGEKINWHFGFGAAAIGMILGMIIFKMLGNKYLEPYGHLKVQDLNITKEKVNIKNQILPFILTLLLIIFLLYIPYFKNIQFYSANGLAKILLIIILSIAVFYFMFILFAGRLNSEEKKRMVVMVIFFTASVLFWSGYEQGGTTLNIFAERYTNRSILNFTIPASWMQSLQSIFVIALAPIMAFVWTYLGRKNKNPSAPIKLGSGLIILGLAFFIMYFAAKLVIGNNNLSPLWLLSTYFFSVLGEVCLSPVGLSFYTKLSPQRFVSQMMGIWFVSLSLGNLISGLIGGEFNKDSVAEMPGMFLYIVYSSVGFGLLMLIFSKQIKKWMGGVE